MASLADKYLSQEAQDRINQITADAQKTGNWAEANAAANKIRQEEYEKGHTNVNYSVSASGTTTFHDDNSTISSNKTGNQASGGKAQQTVNTYVSSAPQQTAQYQTSYVPGSSVALEKGIGYVNGGYTYGVNGTAILDNNPYWNASNGAGADMSRRPDLANKTAISNGYTVFYDENGYATHATKGVTDYLPTQDPYAVNGKYGAGYGAGTYGSGGAWTDQEMMSAADLQAVAQIRADMNAGKYTGDEANALANAIRAKYGYTIDKQGYVTNSHVVTNINDRRNQLGLPTAPETSEQGYYRYLWNTDTSPQAAAEGKIKSYQEYIAGAPSTGVIGAPVMPGQQNTIIGGNNFGMTFNPGYTTAPSVGQVGGVGSGSFAGGSLGNYLDQWLQAAQQQQTQRIDYATQQAINELTRAQADAQAQFQTQRNQIAVEEAKAKDNQALYAERRGDRGGIGASQYDSIMNTAAQNRLAVNQAQTKLSTDTARQISDLRAQGEFEKADALLELSQTYLSQLVALEQWSLEYNLSVAQFNASLEQWAAEFEMAKADITGYYQGAPTMKYQQMQQSQMASAGETLLAAGIMPSASQLSAMGLTAEQAQGYITVAKLAAQAKKSASGSPVVEEEKPSLTAAQARAALVEDENYTINALAAYDYYYGPGAAFTVLAEENEQLRQLPALFRTYETNGSGITPESRAEETNAQKMNALALLHRDNKFSESKVYNDSIYAYLLDYFGIQTN